jgi:16S rRNA (cytidine1402-2'-O)-methyltransferase
MEKGRVFLIPSFLSETNSKDNFPLVNNELIYSLDIFIVENHRTARRFLRKIGFKKDFENVLFFELNKHTYSEEIKNFIEPLLKGENIGLISEAGTPCVADPGSEIVKLAHSLNIDIVPLVGPSSIILALMASGFNGQSFVFHGYLPIDKKQRSLRIREIEHNAYKLEQTQIFIEAPYRNNQLFQSIMENCSSETLVCIAVDITNTEKEFIKTKTVTDWKNNKAPDLHKKPVVFLLYR